MHIPAQFTGRWSGEITDTTRKNPYSGEIIINADKVTTTYFMAQGTQEGKLALHYESDGFLVLKETAESFTGTLLLYLDAASKLKCVWHRGAKLNSEATMTRIEQDNSKLT